MVTNSAHILCRFSYLFGCVYLWKFIATMRACEPFHTDSLSLFRMLLSGRTISFSVRVYAATKIRIIMSNMFVFHFNFFLSDCACAGKMPPGYMSDSYNSSLPFNPIATNGEPFPWFLPNLPNNVRPIRYALTIHPNLTTLDVKGKKLFIFHFCSDCTVARQTAIQTFAANGDYYCYYCR